jgi:hypothetical protein
VVKLSQQARASQRQQPPQPDGATPLPFNKATQQHRQRRKPVATPLPFNKATQQHQQRRKLAPMR